MLTLCKKNSLKSLGFTIKVNLRHFFVPYWFLYYRGVRFLDVKVY